MGARIFRFCLPAPTVLLLLASCSSEDSPEASEGADVEAGAGQIDDASNSGGSTTTVAAGSDASLSNTTITHGSISDGGAGGGDATLTSDPADSAGADAGSSPPPLSISTDGGLQITRDIVVDGLTSDRFTWSDSNGAARSAVLSHNDGGPIITDAGIPSFVLDDGGDGGNEISYGGEMREMDYVVDGGTRVVHASPSEFGGFGYVVSHRSEDRTGINADDSPLGHHFPGTWTRVFEGANHAIFRFSQTYPRYSTTTANPPNTEYDVPVTIEWVFSNGQDSPLWSISYDLSSVPANAVFSDSRAPYGEMLIDGSPTLTAHSLIQGVEWGDRYKFATTSGPVTLGSAWTWDVPNTVPYVDIWTQTIDAMMGIVQTQTMTEHEAGGYWGISRWNTTSGAGNACSFANGDIVSLMPCVSNWSYHTINFELFDTVTPSNQPRLGWGTEFGYLGQTAYYASGSDYYGGPDVDHYDSGWPKQSYSTYIVMGTKTANPVAAQVTQIETVQTITTTAAVGSVATTGPAGINRTDTMTYAPAGYDPIYGALTYEAASNAVDVTLSIGSGTLARPLFIVRGWTTGDPSSIALDGAALTSGTDAYVSVRPDANELWITLARNLTGALHRVQIAGRP